MFGWYFFLWNSVTLLRRAGNPGFKQCICELRIWILKVLSHKYFSHLFFFFVKNCWFANPVLKFKKFGTIRFRAKILPYISTDLSNTFINQKLSNFNFLSQKSVRNFMETQIIESNIWVTIKTMQPGILLQQILKNRVLLHLDEIIFESSKHFGQRLWMVQ